MPGKHGLTLEERFWSKVQKSDGCWEWIAYRNRSGYGKFGLGGRGLPVVLAHRLSWSMVHGDIPEGMFVCHHCDNPPCVRPEHLFVGTCDDNQKDMARKGRGANDGDRWDMKHPLKRPLTWKGETHAIAEWTRRLGFTSHVIYRRISRGWSVEDALSTPVGGRLV